MINTMLGIKKGMTSGYDSRGRRVGATTVQVGPNYITQIKLSEGKDGYNAVQLGFGLKKRSKKPQIGHYKKAGVETNLRLTREVRIKKTPGVEVGQEIKIGNIFSKGDAVKITGISKGKGFSGVVKRYGFAGGPRTHGQSDRLRAPGSIGSGTTPGRVLKGKKMAGHMGVGKVSYLGLEVLSIDQINNLLMVKGGVPGPQGGLVIVEKQGRIKGYTPPPEEKIEEESDDPQNKNEAIGVKGETEDAKV